MMKFVLGMITAWCIIATYNNYFYDHVQCYIDKPR